jgi:hypothetical protein
MQRKWSALAALVALLAGLSFTTAPGAVSAQGTTYTVTIENLTRGQPFTPPLLAVRTSGADLFTVGQASSSELLQIAENGNLDPMVAKLKASPAVSQVVTGNAPVLPGQKATLTVEVPAGSRLSWVSMLICTNDGFTGIDSLALTGPTSVMANAYDAGTEKNTQDFADIVPPCQALVPVSSGDAGTGMSNAALAEGGVIAMHPGVHGGNDLTASHMWSGPVARVTIAMATGGTAVTPPSTGSGGLLERDAGTSLWGVIAIAVLVASSTGAAVAIRRRI